MEKTIKIGKKSVRLNNNVSWAIAYRDQFGRDIIPTIMPLFASALDIISGIINETGKTDDINLEDLAKLADGDSLRQLFFGLGLDFRACAWYRMLLLSDAGDVPVPVCRWFRTCFHRLF